MSRLEAPGPITWLAELLPPSTAAQTHRHLHTGIVLRWVLVAVIAAGGMLTPQVTGFLLYLLAAAAAYNAAIMVALVRAPAAWERRIALAVTCIDQLWCFAFLGIYSSHVAGSQPLGGYAMATIEAVAYFGALGAILSVGIFVACMLAVILLALPVFGHLFDGPGALNSVLLIGMVAVVLVAVLRTRLPASEPSPNGHAAVTLSTSGNGTVRLSRRELEVLHLVAEGYSNTMIASRLRLSDSTVKGYVENLLFRLNVKNRAEAVAAAARLKLL
jgi:DNA-binding CsgD family transcriptional regulator